MKRLLLVVAGVIGAASFHPALPTRPARLQAQASPNVIINPNTYQDLRWRSIGPHRGGRSTAAVGVRTQPNVFYICLLYTSDAADERSSVDLGGRRIIKK